MKRTKGLVHNEENEKEVRRLRRSKPREDRLGCFIYGNIPDPLSASRRALYDGEGSFLYFFLLFFFTSDPAGGIQGTCEREPKPLGLGFFRPDTSEICL